VRIRDLAKRAGVSTQTVSRVLRGSPAVTPATAARVRAAAEELRYYRNEAAASLKRGSTHGFGLVLPLFSWSFFSEVAAGAVAYAHSRGYITLLCDSSASPAKEADYLAMLLGHQVAGVLCVHAQPRPDTRDAYARLQAAGIPVVTISANQDDLACPRVRTDDWRAGYVAARHLTDLGRRRVCVVGVDDSDRSSLDRIEGATAALAEVGLHLSPDRLIITDTTWQGGLRAGGQLIGGGGPLPDGVFATTDIVALGILEVLRGAGRRVPDDIAVIGHDGLGAGALVFPALTTVAPPREQMGRTCIDLLLRAGAGESLPSECMLEATLIVRESTVGVGAARRGYPSPISHPQAWSRWRAQAMDPTVDQTREEGAIAVTDL